MNLQQEEGMNQLNNECAETRPPPLTSETLLRAASSTESSLARIPPILLKAGIWIPYFSSSLFMLLISSSGREKTEGTHPWFGVEKKACGGRGREVREFGNRLFLAQCVNQISDSGWNSTDRKSSHIYK